MTLQVKSNNAWSAVGSSTPAPIVFPDTPNTWTRPAKWLELPTVSEGDEKMVALVPVWDDVSSSATIYATGAYIVDWGDGTVVNYDSGTVNTHLYTYANISNLTWTRGYRQVVVTVTPQAGEHLTTMNLNQRPSPEVGRQYPVPSPWLDICISAPYMTALDVAFTWNVTNGGTFTNQTSTFDASMLERFRWVGSSLITSAAYLFRDCTNLQVVELFDTSDVTDFSSLFWECHSLTAVPALDFSNAEHVSQMYYDCWEVTTLPDFNQLPGTPRFAGTEIQYVFSGCKKLRAIPYIDTSQITSIYFDNCQSIQVAPDIDLSSMTEMSFGQCYALSDLGSFDKYAGIRLWFKGCSLLTAVPDINCDGIESLGIVTLCSSLRSVHLYNLGTVKSLAAAFQGCSSLTSITLEGMEDYDYATNGPIDATRMFAECSSLVESPAIPIPLMDATEMFLGCAQLRKVGALVGDSESGLFLSCQSMFNSCYNLVEAPLFNTVTVTDFSSMFVHCWSLKSVPAYDTYSGVNYSQMFEYCRSLEEVDLQMQGNNYLETFKGCENLKYVGAGVVTTAAINTNSMFYGCWALTYTDPMYLDNVTDARMMFTNSGIRTIHNTLYVNPTGTNAYQNAFDIMPSLRRFLLKMPISYTLVDSGMSVEALNEMFALLPNRIARTITGVVSSGGFATYTTSTPHEFVRGQTVTTSGINPTGYNKSNVRITQIVSDTQFKLAATITTAYVSGGSVAGGTACNVNVRGSLGALTCDTSIATARGWTVTIA